MPATRRTVVLSTLVAGMLLVTLLGAAGTSHAATGVVRVLVSGALGAPAGTAPDGRVTLRLGVGLPVFLLSDGGPVMTGSIATATFAQWTDATPTVGFGSVNILMVFRLNDGSVVTAAGVATPGGLVTTLSSTSPAAALSGTWTISDAFAAGVVGAGPADAVVTAHYDTNPGDATPVAELLWARNPWAIPQSIPGLGGVAVARDVRVDRATVSGSVRVGTLTKYTASDLASEFVQLTAIDFGGVYVLYGCPPSPACLLGGTGPLAHLSGSAREIVPFLPSDIIVLLGGSLP